jgi:hypothetical protein
MDLMVMFLHSGACYMGRVSHEVNIEPLSTRDTANHIARLSMEPIQINMD